MSIFAPVYRPSKHQQTFLVRQQKLENRKRKRGQDSSDEDDGLRTPSSEGDDIPRTPASAFRPVSQTDPYHVAGHSRELPLPPFPFPHAAVQEGSKAKRPIEEELADLNPPLYVLATSEDKSISLRRRHLDNVTTILHTCMLKGDWQRAYRAWSLLIRTEIAGRGIDVRRNGRWGIGAELLMRRKDLTRREVTTKSSDGTEQNEFTLAGFKLAREYYERLILQYPYTARTSSFFNATAIYPALFNIWIYGIQESSKRARKVLHSGKSDEDTDENLSSSLSLNSEESAQLQRIRSEELEQATQLAKRMDELFQSPPYDTDTGLRRLRGMVARWLADLHEEVAGLLERSNEIDEDEDLSEEIVLQSTIDQHRTQAREERNVAEVSFEKVAASKRDM